MAKLSEIAMDVKMAEKGRWVDYHFGIRLLIASGHSPAYRKARSAIIRRHTRGRRLSIDPETIVEMLKPIAARHLLLGWQNIEDEKGKPIDYSPQKALEIFNDPGMADFYDFVLDSAGEAEAYMQQAVEDDAKNLPSA